MSTILGQLSTDLFATLEKSKPKAFKSTHQLLQKAHDEAVAQFKNAGHIEPHQQYQFYIDHRQTYSNIFNIH